ncbi:hypothetical protein HY501_02055 [Candidatus Woesearchaeota archaeon]|nr:hypothetical protein [Candidatus Woesearchaeota archaeon]
MVYAFAERIAGKIPGVFDAWLNVTLANVEAYEALESFWESGDFGRYIRLFRDPNVGVLEARAAGPYRFVLRRDADCLRGELTISNDTREPFPGIVFILSINPSAYASQLQQAQPERKP